MSSSKFKSMNIGDLPDLVLVNILCRLPLKSTFQCKCVSKSWYILISNPYFVRRFLCIQFEEEKRITRTMIFSNNIERKREYFSINKHPLSKLHSRTRFSLSFLPCYGSAGTEPLVVGTYKDLICCCATCFNQCHYYICNPYIKQWVALPPTPQCHKEVLVGFLCGPKEDDDGIGDRKEEYYKYKIVQIIIPDDIPGANTFQFCLQMFCSENGKWTEAVASSPRSFALNRLSNDAGVVHNGMLYWRGVDFIIGLNPYSNDNIYSCRFIDKPAEVNRTIDYLGMCQGSLRICQLFPYLVPSGQTYYGVSIWEFKDNDHEVDGEWCLVDRFYTDQMESRNRLITDWGSYWRRSISVQGFDPIKEDVLYLELCQHLFRYNIRTKTFKNVTFAPYEGSKCSGRRAFPFVISLWPTLKHQYASACPS